MLSVLFGYLHIWSSALHPACLTACPHILKLCSLPSLHGPVLCFRSSSSLSLQFQNPVPRLASWSWFLFSLLSPVCLHDPRLSFLPGIHLPRTWQQNTTCLSSRQRCLPPCLSAFMAQHSTPQSICRFVLQNLFPLLPEPSLPHDLA